MMPGTGCLLFAGAADGLELVTRSYSYRKNDKTLKQFRKDLERALDEEPESFKKPNYGVVTTTYRNPEEVTKTLSNFINEVGIDPSDIVVVDDYSNDGGKTADAARKFGVKVIELDENTEKVGAQRRGMEEMLRKKKKYTLASDSDTILATDKETLEKSMIEMEVFDLDAMAIRILPEAPLNHRKKKRFLEKLQYLEYNQAMRLGRGSMYAVRENNKTTAPPSANARERLKVKYGLKSGRVINISGAFGIYNSQTLKDVLDHQDNVWVGDDFEHSLRILGDNKNIGYNDDAVAITACPKNIKELTKQRILWSAGYFRLQTTPKIVKKLYRDKKGRAKLDRAGATVALQVGRDIAMHPLKIIDLPLLVMKPEIYMPVGGFYYAANTYACAATRKKGEPIYPLASAALPLYRAYNLFVPTTIGYVKNAKDRVKDYMRKDWTRTKADFKKIRSKFGRRG